MYTALTATSQTIAELLRQRLISELPSLFDSSSGGTMVVSLNTPQEMTENNASGLSIWLYRVARDDQRLNAPPERLDRKRLRRTPLPARLHYLITPIVNGDNESGPENEQRILGKVLQTFHDHPKLRGTDLQGDLGGSTVELTVRLESLGLEEITRVWAALNRSYQLSVSYEVSVVYIDSELEPHDVSPVHVALPEYGLIVSSEQCGWSWKMTRRIVEVKDRTYTFSPDDEVSLAGRTWAIVSARVVDEMTLEPPKNTLTITTDESGLMPHVINAGLVGLVGRPGQVFPDLANQSYQVNLTVMAEGYIPRQEQVAIAQNPNFPNTFEPAEFDLFMHRRPVTIRGRTTVANGNTTSPIGNATVTITGVWRTFPPANVVVNADPPNVVSLQPSLYFFRTAATGRLRRRAMTPVVGEDKRLLDEVPKGSNNLRLSDRVNLSPGDIILIEPANRDLSEYLIIDTISGASTADQPAKITLTYPVAYHHRHGPLVQKVTPQILGPINQFAQDAIAGDTCVFLASLNGLDPGGVVEISGGGNPAEYHALSRFTKTSDSDGYFRLPLLSRVAQLEIQADDAGAHPTITRTFSPDYSHRENRIDFVFR